MKRQHHMPFGAEVRDDGSVRFRLWAPGAAAVELDLRDGDGQFRLPMTAANGGWFEIVTGRARPGSRYAFRLPDGLTVPDPASRFQPEDVHAASEVIDPRAFAWHDREWRGRPWEETILYELHVGTFTPQGTFRAAITKLDHLATLGVTALELMPVADFPGRRNWGYDGVLPFAPDASYGRPEDLKALVNAAHARGLTVFLDVVYNHFGPEGNYLHRYAPLFFSNRHHTPWGAAINFDDAGSRAVRDFFVHNALYWLEEYHFDGLRLDAVHAILDDSRPDILCELAQAVAAGPGRARHVHLVLENDRNQARYLARDAAHRPKWYSAQWNDDLHHALHVLTTGETSGYYEDYADRPAYHLGRALAEGFSYQGEPSRHRHGAPRGEPSRDLPPAAFVNFLQTHDQVGNRALGERLSSLTTAAALRAATVVVLLAPSPPLLFMGQEWATRRPFPFFCDFAPELAEAVRAGRRREFSRFPAFSDPAVLARLPDPVDPQTFAEAVLDWREPEMEDYRAWLELHRELLAVRRDRLVPRLTGSSPPHAHWTELGGHAVRVDWRLNDGSRLTLVANLADTQVAGVERPPGELLYASPASADVSARLPEWYAAWYLAASGADTRS
jgi:malto-oligosyltrehalose trehalohydrolase